MITSSLAVIGLTLMVAGGGALLAGSERYRMLLKVLDRPWRFERFIYRHHLAFGMGIVAGAGFLLFVLARHHDLSIQSISWPTSRGAQLMLLGRAVAWLFAALALFIGLIVVIRPSLLKGVETSTNRWIDPSLPALFRSMQLGTLLLVAGIGCLLMAAVITS